MRWCVLALEFPWWVHPFNMGDGIWSEESSTLCSYSIFKQTEKNKVKFQIKDVAHPLMLHYKDHSRRLVSTTSFLCSSSFSLFSSTTFCCSSSARTASTHSRIPWNTLADRDDSFQWVHTFPCCVSFHWAPCVRGCLFVKSLLMFSEK